MKHLIVIFLACVTALVLLTGCTKTTICAECGEVKKCKQYSVEFAGEKAREYICDDCYTLLKGLLPLTGGSIK